MSLVQQEHCEKMVEVGWLSGVIAILLVFEVDVMRLICGYAPRSGRFLKEMQYFYDELKSEWDMHSVDDSVVCVDDYNGCGR